MNSGLCETYGVVWDRDLSEATGEAGQGHEMKAQEGRWESGQRGC